MADGKVKASIAEAIAEVFAEHGRRGGKAGTGKAKRRTKAHYRAMGLKSAAARRKAKREREKGDKT